jgi:hypothetical protein
VSLCIGVNTKNFLKFSKIMRYYLKNIGADWNEVLDEYLDLKETNKELNWHDYYIEKSESKERIIKLFEQIEKELLTNNQTGIR